MTDSTKAPILAVLFIERNGSMLSWSRDEIRANPEGFRRYAAAERARGINPLAMRGHTFAA